MSVAQETHTSSFPSLRGGFRHALLATALVLAISACKDDTATTDPAAQQTGQAATQATAPAGQVVSAQVAAMSVDQLREAATRAQAEVRMYAPAGNNAMEYFLALRDKQPNDAAVANALTDLMPYALIATEQSIQRDDFAEAKRLYGMMEKADKSAPALPRLKAAIAQAEATFAQRQQQTALDTAAEQERQAKLEEDRKRQQEEEQKRAAQQLAQQQQQASVQAQREAAQREAAEREAAQREAAQREAAQREAAQREAAAREAAARNTASQPATASANDLRALSTPSPKYPPEALRSGQSGEVLVEFTVGTDGSVTNARVVRGNPPRVFDREAVAAVKRWRFQPIASPVTTRRTIGFKPGN